MHPEEHRADEPKTFPVPPEIVKETYEPSYGPGIEPPNQSEEPSAQTEEAQAPPVERTGPWKETPVTLGMLILIIAVYGFTSYPVFDHPAQSAIAQGAFIPEAVAQGEWWRYITATLMHGNLGHLLSNAFGILVFGRMLEPALGPSRMLTLYALSAFTGLLLSYTLFPNTVTIGASTIDYGLIGTYFTLILSLRYGTDRRLFHQELRGAFAFFLLFVVWNTMEIGVNLWGHIGGFFAGIAYGLWSWSNRRGRNV